jgi:hypothetical protein
MMPARVAPDFGRGVATWLQVGLPLSGPRLARGGPGSVQTADTGPSDAWAVSDLEILAATAACSDNASAPPPRKIAKRFAVC